MWHFLKYDRVLNDGHYTKCRVPFPYPVFQSRPFYWGIESIDVEILRDGYYFFLLCLMLFLFLSGFLLSLMEEGYYLSFPGCSFPPCIGVFLILSFVELGQGKRYCVNLVLSWNILISPSMLIESFDGYGSLG